MILQLPTSRKCFFACVHTLSCHIPTATICQASTQHFLRARELTCKFCNAKCYLHSQNGLHNFGYKVGVDDKK